MYTVDCKNTMFHPQFFLDLVNNGIKISKKQTTQAQILFVLAAALPTAPAGVLYDVVTGKTKCRVDGEKFIIETQEG